ncbi:hypothetical protein JHL18_04110 [Clostridium sp. YIM B02505]|uniref:Uncharacterized protein n=1 Tax=Clostridium yunnanense TaxID=2800325 RepID=A0ABS1EKC8_9CLOT|nr:hypothetical protein [Clostridium yunnanense]MBK1809823.1 hypothetical protein [Clostridium yunnanense]
MKKLLIPVIIVILILIGGGAAYKYFNGPKIVDITLTKSVDDKGRPTESTNTFTSKDTVYLSAKGKKLAIKNATVVWYKGKVSTQNRFKVEENIEISKAGYFTAKLSVPEGLEEGQYGATIYNAGNHIIEKIVEFEVKN